MYFTITYDIRLTDAMWPSSILQEVQGFQLGTGGDHETTIPCRVLSSSYFS